jgi:hypothetical protein
MMGAPVTTSQDRIRALPCWNGSIIVERPVAGPSNELHPDAPGVACAAHTGKNLARLADALDHCRSKYGAEAS